MKHLKIQARNIAPLGELVYGQINNLLEKAVYYWIGDTCYSKELFEKVIVDKIREADAFIAEENYLGKKLDIQVVLMPEWSNETLDNICKKLSEFKAPSIEIELEYDEDILKDRDLHLVIQTSKLTDNKCIVFELYSFPHSN